MFLNGKIKSLHVLGNDGHRRNATNTSKEVLRVCYMQMPVCKGSTLVFKICFLKVINSAQSKIPLVLRNIF
jgi:hypothetical protein